MSDEMMNQLSDVIAKEHGIRLVKEDPILMLETANNHLINQSEIAQQKLFKQLDEALESKCARWHDESKAQSERILNASLNASKKTLHDSVIEEQSLLIEKLNRLFDEKCEEMRAIENNIQLAPKYNLAASVITFLSACIIAVVAVWVVF